MIEPGTLLQNRYRVAKQIGQGGMGAVYFATDERFGSTVAVKQTFFDDPALSRAFEREAQLLNRLRHGALPRVSDHFSEGDGQFLVMEFIEGSDASELLAERGGPLPHEDVLRWADELLDALDYLHTQRQPVIHRDIKPQNLKLTPRGNAVLLDFGLAKGESQQQTRATEAASVFGYSRNYAPLEQIQGTGTDARSDIYSLGATLYHLLTGRAPVDALTRAGALIKNQPDPLRPAHRANAQVPAPVGDILHRAMALNPALRPRTAAELRAALRQAAGPNAARRTTPTPSAYTQGRAASAEATLVDSQAQPPGERPTTQLRQPSLTHSESTVVDGARDATRRPYSYAASSLPEPAEEPARKSPARLLVAAALVLLVACAAVPFVLMQGSTAPPAASDAQTETSPDAQTSAPDPARAGGDGEAEGASSPAESAPAQTRAPAARTDGETTSTSAQTAPAGGGAANEAANAGAGGLGTSSVDAGQVSPGAEAGRQGLVIHQSAPSPAPADSEEETRRAEELRRAQTRPQPQPAGAYYPPPGGHRPPPPDGRWPPPPPPRRRP